MTPTKNFIRCAGAIVVSFTLISTAVLANENPKKNIDNCEAWAKAPVAGVTNEQAKKTIRDNRLSLCNTAASTAKIAHPDADSVGFKTLGITPGEFNKPRNPADLAASLLSGVDPDGKYQNGIALEVSPFMLLAGKDFTIAKYQESWFQRLKANTRVALATSRSEDEGNNAQQIALSLQFTPWVANDPLRNAAHIGCMDESFNGAANEMAKAVGEWKAANSGQTPNLFDPDFNEFRAKKRKQIRELFITPSLKECREKFEDKNWNTSGWSLGLTPAWTSTEGNVDNLTWSGLAMWSSLSINPEDFYEEFNIGGSLNLQFRYRMDETVVSNSSTGATFERDTTVATLGYEFGASHLNMAIEASYLNRENETRKDDEFYQFSANLKWRIPNTMIWVNSGIGGTSGRSNGNEGFFRTSFSWAYNDTSGAGK